MAFNVNMESILFFSNSAFIVMLVIHIYFDVLFAFMQCGLCGER